MMHPKRIAHRPSDGPSLFVFSGGTAFNGYVASLKNFSSNIVYTLPISDDGGSTAEITRVFGGPGIGDIRSRLIRLCEGSGPALRKLLEHRLPSNNRLEAEKEWAQIVEGKHELWTDIRHTKAIIVRQALVGFHAAMLGKRHVDFDFRNASIGNLFFTGLRMQYDSLSAAIFLFSRIVGIPTETQVLPIIDQNDPLTIGVKLRSGGHILGQNEISHPSVGSGLSTVVNKESVTTLPSPIQLLYYINKDAQRIRPSLNADVLRALQKPPSRVVYAPGSLYTSILPSLIVPGIGEMLATLSSRKILMTNSQSDRETLGIHSLYDYVMAITNGLNRYGELSNLPFKYIDEVWTTAESEISRDDGGLLERMGIMTRTMPSEPYQAGKFGYSTHALIEGLGA